MRIGAKKRPFYRVVAVDERAKRTGGYLELLGTYNPLTNPHDINLKQDRIDHWMKQGAKPSDGFLRMIGKAPKRPPRKPKKEKKVEEPKAEVTPATEQETPAAEQPPTPVETQEPETPPGTSPSEAEPKVDDSTEEPKSTEGDTSESVQNK